MTNHEAEARPRRFTDQRGIALQTVIIMVVMLAIAGAIAAVLLSRGNEASSQLETQSLGVGAASYTTESLCEAAGHAWTDPQTPSKCKATNVGQYLDEKACEANGGTWTSGNSTKCA